MKKTDLEKVVKENKRVLVYYYNRWCPSCKLLINTIDEFIQINPSIVLFKVCVSDCENFYQEFLIDSVPYTSYYEDGVLKNELDGFIQFDEILELIK